MMRGFALRIAQRLGLFPAEGWGQQAGPRELGVSPRQATNTHTLVESLRSPHQTDSSFQAYLISSLPSSQVKKPHAFTSFNFQLIFLSVCASIMHWLEIKNSFYLEKKDKSQHLSIQWEVRNGSKLFQMNVISTVKVIYTALEPEKAPWQET